MRLLTAILMTAALSLALAGCQKGANQSAVASPNQPQDADAQIRAAIQTHLTHDSTLNPQAFDTDVKQVTIDGNHAQAQVGFRLKNGPEAMQLTYQLENREGSWAVIDSNTDGGNFSHPPANQSQSPVVTVPGASHSLSDTLRSFKSDGSAAPSPALPPDHPAVSQTPGYTPQ